MKRFIITAIIAAVFGMVMGTVPAMGQVVHSEDGTEMSYDNLILGRKPLPWQFEASVRQVATMGWIPQLVTVGMRKGDLVLGIGSGHGMMTYDAHPATISYIPIFAYNRYYFPLGSKRRFSLYTDAFLGYQTIYRITGDTSRLDTKKGDGSFVFSWQPGISVRMWGKSNLFLGLVVVNNLSSFAGIPLFGLHLGLAI